MGTLEFEDRKYTFSWGRIALLFVGAPIFALIVYFSHQWFWLHGITSKFTVWLLNLIYPGSFASIFKEYNLITWVEYFDYMISGIKIISAPWNIGVTGSDGIPLGTIGFETLCTGVHAMAIFIGVILFTPHPKEEETKKDIWRRKILAMVTTSVIFYFVNVIRMMIQLSLYRNGANWDDVHYPISAASSFIAVACVLVMHKFVPEFIMGLIWIGDELREIFNKPRNPEEIANLIHQKLENSTEINLKDFEKTLLLPKNDFQENIVKWAEDYQFILSDETITINRDTIDSFLEHLNASYAAVENDTEIIEEEMLENSEHSDIITNDVIKDV